MFQQETAPFRLTTSDSRAEAIATLGVSVLFEIVFNHDFYQISSEDFIDLILKDTLGLRHVVCGYDFVFGHRRRGTPDMLQTLGRDAGIGVTCMPAVIGFPTCNLRIVDLIQPAHGVYAIWVRIEDEAEWRPGVANFGRRPTVNDRGALFEAHLFDVARDLYNKRLSIRVIDFIRPEMRFSGLNELTAQIAKDASRAREILS